MRPADRRHHWKTRIKNWLPVCLWASLIFSFRQIIFRLTIRRNSLDWFSLAVLPAIPTEDVLPVHGAMRKVGHWAEYFVLAVLVLRALSNETGKKWELRHAALTFVFVFVYALSDELHQTFVPSRTRASATS